MGWTSSGWGTGLLAPMWFRVLFVCLWGDTIQGCYGVTPGFLLGVLGGIQGDPAVLVAEPRSGAS